MDKLEKALEKARKQRASGGEEASPASQGKAAREGVRENVEPTVRLSASVLPPDMEDCFEANRIVAHRTRSPEADAFRILRSQVLQTMTKAGFKTLAITSPNYGDGKTTIALNLAISIAQDLKQTVLLVDLDLRKPSIHRYLGIESDYGLTDYLAGQADIPYCLQRLPFERLSVLPAGNMTEHSSEILGSPQMAALADELKNRYPDRLMIYDMPPILAQDDPLAFLPHVDAVLLIARDGVTRTEDIKRSLDILEPANVIGTVLNDS